MKPINVVDLGTIRNELNKYKKGKKLDIRQFNQAARLAWLGKLVLCPLDPEDPECRAWLMHVEPLDGLAEQVVTVDPDLAARIHIVDAEQGQFLAEVLRQGVEERVTQLEALDRRDFYFGKFFRPGDKPQQ